MNTKPDSEPQTKLILSNAHTLFVVDFLPQQCNKELRRITIYIYVSEIYEQQIYETFYPNIIEASCEKMKFAEKRAAVHQNCMRLLYSMKTIRAHAHNVSGTYLFWGKG